MGPVGLRDVQEPVGYIRDNRRRTAGMTTKVCRISAVDILNRGKRTVSGQSCSNAGIWVEPGSMVERIKWMVRQ